MVVKSISLFGKELIRVERNRQGQFTYSFLDGNSFVDNGRYLELSLTNPVLMTIIALRSSLYSQMKIKHVNSKGVEIENSDVLKLLSKPNYFQSQNDWLYQQMWFLSCSGTNLVYQIKAFKNELPKAVYNLIPSEIELNDAHKINKFIVTQKDFNAFGERKIKYTLDRTVYDLSLSELIPLYDLSNGLTVNTFFQSPSRQVPQEMPCLRHQVRDVFCPRHRSSGVPEIIDEVDGWWWQDDGPSCTCYSPRCYRCGNHGHSSRLCAAPYTPAICVQGLSWILEVNDWRIYKQRLADCKANQSEPFFRSLHRVGRHYVARVSQPCHMDLWPHEDGKILGYTKTVRKLSGLPTTIQ